MPKQEDGGWRRRIRIGIDDLLTELEALAPAEAQARLVDMVANSRMDIGKKTIEGLYKDLFVGEKRKRGADRMRSEDNFEVFSEKRHGDAFIELVEMRVKGRMKGETDEPVTSDIKRLIRLPSSLHGKTGFEVVPMSREKLNTFNPFADAVSRSFGEAGVDVHCEKPVEVTLKERRFLLGEGKNDVPEYLAVYLVCRKLARIES
jgi:DNA primase small subunit